MQPQRDLSDTGGEFLDLDAIELMDVEFGKPIHVVERHFALAAVQLYKDFELQLAEFAVSEDEEVAAAARGIEETEIGQLVVKLLQTRGAAGRSVVIDVLELSAEVVEEQRADQFQDVLFRRVVRADLPAFLAVHDRLEERTEHGRER